MKTGMVGCGVVVGSPAAYPMALKGTVKEIVIVDPNEKMAQAQAGDHQH
jgi:malate/lactate dehydrogenase